MQWRQGLDAVQLPLKPPIKWLPRLSADNDTKLPLNLISPLLVVNVTPFKNTS